MSDTDTAWWLAKVEQYGSSAAAFEGVWQEAINKHPEGSGIRAAMQSIYDQGQRILNSPNFAANAWQRARSEAEENK